MTDDTHAQDGPQGLDEAELAQDLELEDAEETDAVKGGIVVTEIVGRPMSGAGE
jgi:hypothetical protein